MYSGNGVLLEFGIVEICDIALQQIVDNIAIVFKTMIFVFFLSFRFLQWKGKKLD